MIFFRDIRWERGAGSTTGVARVEKPNQNPTRQNLKIMENRQVLALFPALSIRKLFCVLEIYFLTISDRFAGVLRGSSMQNYLGSSKIPSGPLRGVTEAWGAYTVQSSISGKFSGFHQLW